MINLTDEKVNHEHLYQSVLKDRYKDNTDLYDIIELLLKTKAECVAQLYALQNLLVTKKIITIEEAKEAFSEEKLSSYIDIIEDGYDKTILGEVQSEEIKTDIS